VVRGRKNDALDAFTARRLEQVVAADDIGLQDRIPGTLDRVAAKMKNAVDAFADRLDLGEIGQIGSLELFSWGPRSAGAFRSLNSRSG
jgi:hypothetical protein